MDSTSTAITTLADVDTWLCEGHTPGSWRSVERGIPWMLADPPFPSHRCYRHTVIGESILRCPCGARRSGRSGWTGRDSRRTDPELAERIAAIHDLVRATAREIAEDVLEQHRLTTRGRSRRPNPVCQELLGCLRHTVGDWLAELRVMNHLWSLDLDTADATLNAYLALCEGSGAGS
jgi:hypothetical protein